MSAIFTRGLRDSPRLSAWAVASGELRDEGVQLARGAMVAEIGEPLALADDDTPPDVLVVSEDAEPLGGELEVLGIEHDAGAAHGLGHRGFAVGEDRYAGGHRL